MEDKNQKSKKTIAAIGLLLLTGCAYKERNAEVAAIDARVHGYQNIANSVRPGEVKIIFGIHGAPRSATYSLSNANNLCTAFQRVASVQDNGRENLPSFVAALNETFGGRKQFQEWTAVANGPVAVKGVGHWSIETAYSRKTEKCEAPPMRFVPTAGHAYLVDFLWTSRGCRQVVQDVTDPDNLLDVNTDVLLACME